MDQKRLLLAFALSAVILFGWTFLVERNAPRPTNANSNQSATTTPTASPANVPAATPQQQQTQAAPGTDNVPQRSVTVKSPLYEATFSARGAVATSWVLKNNQRTGQPLYSVAGGKNSPQPLELIPTEKYLQSAPENVRQEARSTALRLLTGDDAFDNFLASRNYRIDGVEGESGDARVELRPGETKTITFTLRDEATGGEVIKSLSFNGDSYGVGMAIKLARGGQVVPAAKLGVGPSIGDQGIAKYSFYSIAPEGVSVVNGKAQIFYATSVHENKNSQDRQIVNGTIDWSGVADTYFAMAAVPPRPSDELELRTTRYEHEADGAKEERFLLTSYLRVPTDGSTTQIYVGPKDHNLLATASAEVSKNLQGRTVDLEGLINYGSWFGFVTRHLAPPFLAAIEFFQRLTNSYGVAIILFTVVIYSFFFPLKWRSSKSMKRAQKLAPKMKELQEKIKGMKQNDPRLKELQMEQLRLMKEGNPLGGCLPLLIQMPFLIAVYTAITISLDFRMASFLWIHDLSAAEPYTIHLLPILMAASMLVMQLVTPAPSADPLQKKMMMVMMPVMMLYILWSAPSGLLVYWIVGNFVGFGQQMLINRLVKSEDDGEPPQEVDKQRAKKLKAARVSQA
ncbi:MAG: membrane protein insertase YidC [Acidobacteria bacterium]|nr:membrane protein insertase YidC [Acidobacteriota bacterium]MCA1642700.1 membrane protein insertase YidC [Acidobacteriota bacterium]